MGKKYNNKKHRDGEKPKSNQGDSKADGSGLFKLKTGKNNHFYRWKEALQSRAIQDLGYLGMIIKADKYVDPPQIPKEGWNLNDELEKSRYLKMCYERDKAITTRMLDAPKLYELIYQHLSIESIDMIKRLPDFEEIETTMDPLKLWLAVKKTHQMGSESYDANVQCDDAREAYQSMAQGKFEGIAAYKKRFSESLKAYLESGNAPLSDRVVAFDFFRGLDNARYREFKADLKNDQLKRVEVPENLTDMYERAARFVIPAKSWSPGSGAAFVTSGEINRSDDNKKNDGKSQAHQDSGGQKKKAAGEKKVDHGGEQPGDGGGKKRDVICWNCNEKGHFRDKCPKRNKRDDEDDECGSAMVCTGSAFHTQGCSFQWYEVLLDNQADISILHPRLLTELKPVNNCFVSGVSGHKISLPWVGYLKDFFECKGSTDVVANVLCMADVEDMYTITYVQGESYTVHLPDEDLVFERRGKMYVGDMRNWAEDRAFCVREIEEHNYDWDTTSDSMALVATVAARESEYTKSEVKKAKLAQELIVNAGYVSEAEALDLIQSGNVMGVPITAADVRRAFEIYGRHPASVRGKMTSKRSSRQLIDLNLKATQSGYQTVYGDVMHALKHQFLASMAEPLGLMMLTEVESLKSEALAEALSGQVDALKTRGFKVRVYYLDPQSGFKPLEGNIPGIEVDICGAGDHMDKLDAGIRRLKDIMRSVYHGLPWPLPDSMVKYLAYYSVHLKNMRSTSRSKVAPWVKLTGRKVQWKTLTLAFGFYVECYDPKCTSNKIDSGRSEPCIALYPTGIANGSWWFFNMKTRRVVRRTNWTVMVTSDLVIGIMTELAVLQAKDGVLRPEFDESDVSPRVEELGDVQHDDVQLGLSDSTVGSHMFRGEKLEKTPEGFENIGKPLETVVNDNTFMYDEHRGDVGEAVVATGDQDIDHSDHSDSEDSEEDIGEEDDYFNVVMYDDRNDPDTGEKRSNRIAARSGRDKVHGVYYTSVKRSLKEFGDNARKSMVDELSQLIVDKKAMHPVKRDELSQKEVNEIVRSFMLTNEKFDGMGNFEKYKSRLVVDGSQQDRKLFPDVSSPTVMNQSVMMCLVIAAHENRKVAAMDIGGAYLNADRQGADVIMELERDLTTILCEAMPNMKEFVGKDGKILMKLDKALYGCLDSAKLWYECLTKTLRGYGFAHNEVDPCVMNVEKYGVQMTVAVYVDDLLVTCVNENAINEFYDFLKTKFDKVKFNLDKDLSYLGMHIQVNSGEVVVSMKAYLQKVIAEFGITGVVTTPATDRLFKFEKEEELIPAWRGMFHTVVAQVAYAAKKARFDALLTASTLTPRVKCPDMNDKRKLDRLLKYLSGTLDHVLILKPRGNLNVVGYIDAAFGCHPDGKSHTGLVVTVGGATVLCASTKQKIVTKNSTEAELVGLSDKVMSVIQCEEFMKHQGHDLPPPDIMQDNTSTITLVKDGGGQYRTKYMRVRQGFVKERLDAGEIDIKYLRTTGMLADYLTKPLQGELYRVMTRAIMGMKASRHRGALTESSLFKDCKQN